MEPISIVLGQFAADRLGRRRGIGPEPGGEPTEGGGTMLRLRMEILVRVEHPGVEIGDGRRSGLVQGKNDDAGREAAGGVRQHRPHEPLGIVDGGESGQIGPRPPGGEPAADHAEAAHHARKLLPPGKSGERMQ